MHILFSDISLVDFHKYERVVCFGEGGHHTKHGFDLRKLTPKSPYMGGGGGGGAMREVRKMSEVSPSLPKRSLHPQLDW